MRAWLLALALGGCGFQSAEGPGTGSGSGLDAGAPPPDGPDVAIDASPPVHVCLGTFVQVCTDVPGVALSLAAGTIDTADTSASSKCLPAAAYTTTPVVDACVIAARSITVPTGTKVSVIGTRRLILLASDALTIVGTLDAASHRNGPTGPAADAGPCPTNFTNPTTATQGGGSWGGTFGKPGNNGGNTPGGGKGGGAGGPLNITTFGGGCPGGDGADNAGGNGGGNGGHGGGAVLLLAGQSIAISGTLNASGSGGNGGRGRGGGGGGGAGGMIVLEAPSVTVPGKCFANGGGGGEGSSGLVDGGNGGESSAPDSAGGGGVSLSVGGDGGNGGVGTTGSKAGDNGGSIVNPVVDTGGGGAGGGGVGIIKISSGNQGDPALRDPKKVAPPPS